MYICWYCNSYINISWSSRMKQIPLAPNPQICMGLPSFPKGPWNVFLWCRRCPSLHLWLKSPGCSHLLHCLSFNWQKVYFSWVLAKFLISSSIATIKYCQPDLEGPLSWTAGGKAKAFPPTLLHDYKIPRCIAKNLSWKSGLRNLKPRIDQLLLFFSSR